MDQMNLDSGHLEVKMQLCFKQNAKPCSSAVWEENFVALEPRLEYSSVDSCLACMCLPARNGLVNKVEIRGPIPQNVVRTNDVARLLIIK